MFLQFKHIISLQFYTYKYYVNLLLHIIKKDVQSFQWIKGLKSHLIFLAIFGYVCYSIILTTFQILLHLNDNDSSVINVFIAALIFLYSINLTADIGKKNIRLFFMNSPFNRKYIYRALVASELGLPMFIFVLTFVLFFPVLVGQIVLNKLNGLIFCLNILFLFFAEIFFVSSIKLFIFSIAHRWEKMKLSFHICEQIFILITSILVTIFFEKIYFFVVNGIKSLFNHNFDAVIEFFGQNGISLYSFNYFPISLVVLTVSFFFFLVTYHQIAKNIRVVEGKRKKRQGKGNIPIVMMMKQYGLFSLHFLFSTVILNMLYTLRAEQFHQDAGLFVFAIGFISLFSLTEIVLPEFFAFLYKNQLLIEKKGISLVGIYNLLISSILLLIFLLFTNIKVTTNILYFFSGILITVPLIMTYKHLFLWISRTHSVSLAKTMSYYFPTVIFIPMILLFLLLD